MQLTHSNTHTHAVSVLCSLKVIKPNEALQGHAAFSVFFEMMRGFVPGPQWNKRVEREGQKLVQSRSRRQSDSFETSRPLNANSSKLFLY